MTLIGGTSRIQTVCSIVCDPLKSTFKLNVATLLLIQIRQGFLSLSLNCNKKWFEKDTHLV